MYGYQTLTKSNTVRSAMKNYLALPFIACMAFSDGSCAFLFQPVDLGVLLDQEVVAYLAYVGNSSKAHHLLFINNVGHHFLNLLEMQ